MRSYKDVLIEENFDYGNLEFNIEKLLKERGLSKNIVCRHLDISRTIFNKYCSNKSQRIDANLVCKLCYFLECSVDDLITYVRPENGE